MDFRFRDFWRSRTTKFQLSLAPAKVFCIARFSLSRSLVIFAIYRNFSKSYNAWFPLANSLLRSGILALDAIFAFILELRINQAFTARTRGLFAAVIILLHRRAYLFADSCSSCGGSIVRAEIETLAGHAPLQWTRSPRRAINPPGGEDRRTSVVVTLHFPRRRRNCARRSAISRAHHASRWKGERAGAPARCGVAVVKKRHGHRNRERRRENERTREQLPRRRLASSAWRLEIEPGAARDGHFSRTVGRSTQGITCRWTVNQELITGLYTARTLYYYDYDYNGAGERAVPRELLDLGARVPLLRSRLSLISLRRFRDLARL